MPEQFTKGYALLVGVGQYQNQKLTVPQSASDAEDIRNVLTDSNYCGYPPEQVTVLSHKKATGDNIIASLNKFAHQVAGQQATAILLFSGHGWHQSGEFYFLPYEAEITNQYGNIAVKPETAISNEVLISHIRTISQRAARTLVIFHSCHSGGLGIAFGPEDTPLTEHLTGIPLSIFEHKFDDLAQGEGIAILTSSQQDQLSWGIKGHRNSIFISRVIATLKGDGLAADRSTVDLLPFVDAVNRSVRQLALERINKVQQPDFKLYRLQGDFPIALRLGGQAMGVAELASMPPSTDTITEGDAIPMSGIPPKLYNEMREILLDCDLFDSHHSLRAFFADQRISPWRNRLPEADSQASRVETMMSFLHNKFNTSNQNGLVLLLYVLIDKLDANDMCRQRLQQVATEFGQAIQGTPNNTEVINMTNHQKWNIAVFTDFLKEALMDQELRTLCFKHFPDVHDDIAKLTKTEIIVNLLDYCQRKERLDELEHEAALINPRKYQRFKDKLH